METFELVVERFGIALLVVRIAEEEIAQWKTSGVHSDAKRPGRKLA